MATESSDDTADEPMNEYECLRCGTIVTSKSHPGGCPDCGNGLQGRHNSLE